MKKEYDLSKAKRIGPLIPRPGKTKITIRIDNDVLNWYRDQCVGGGDYQAMINDALRSSIKVEQQLRRVIRNELAGYTLRKKPRS